MEAKIISLVAAVLFVFNSAVCGMDASAESYLRVPVGQNNAFKRMTRVIRNWTTKEDPAENETLQRVRDNAELRLFPEVRYVDMSIEETIAAFQLRQDAKDIRKEALWLIRQAIPKQADPYIIREILLEAIEFNREINWHIFIVRIGAERTGFVKRAHMLLQQAVALERESDKLMGEMARPRQNSYGALHMNFLNAARSI